jgi:hypothetical protein
VSDRPVPLAVCVGLDRNGRSNLCPLAQPGIEGERAAESFDSFAHQLKSEVARGSPSPRIEADTIVTDDGDQPVIVASKANLNSTGLGVLRRVRHRFPRDLEPH